MKMNFTGSKETKITKLFGNVSVDSVEFMVFLVAINWKFADWLSVPSKASCWLAIQIKNIMIVTLKNQENLKLS